MRFVCLALLITLLSACTPLSQQKTPVSEESLWQQRSVNLQKLSPWAFRGRTAFTQDREGWNAGVDWSQQTSHFLIKLYGPFAQGGAELAGDNTLVTLTLDNGETFSSNSPEALLAETMNLQMPVSALRDWVRGLPYAALSIDDKTLDEKGRLLTLKQAGWEIEYKGYMPFENYSMPAKVYIRYPKLTIKLVIDDWRRP